MMQFKIVVAANPNKRSTDVSIVLKNVIIAPEQ
jgi:hypothetical protein